MSHTVTYNSEECIIETKIVGALVLGEAKELIAQIVQVAKEKNCFLCLSDYREAELKLSIFEIYDTPKIITDVSASQELLSGRFKRAIVVKEVLQDFYFYETVTLNSGQNAKLFKNIDEAKEWLLHK